MPKVTDLESFPATRTEAGRKGIKFFYPGEICDEGHDGLWYYSTNSCVGCVRQRAKESQYEKTRRPKDVTPAVILGADWSVRVMG